MNVIYDAGVLVAADRGDRACWADHRARLELGIAPVTTAPVVAQVSRSNRQAELRRFLRGCQVEPFAADQAHGVGALLASAGGSDVVDAHLVLAADVLGGAVLTSDMKDLALISAGLTSPIKLLPMSPS